MVIRPMRPVSYRSRFLDIFLSVLSPSYFGEVSILTVSPVQDDFKVRVTLFGSISVNIKSIPYSIGAFTWSDDQF